MSDDFMKGFLQNVAMSATGGELIQKQIILYTNPSEIVYINEAKQIELLNGPALQQMNEANPDLVQRIRDCMVSVYSGNIPNNIFALVPKYPMCVLATIYGPDISLKLVNISTLINKYFIDEACTTPLTNVQVGGPIPLFEAPVLDIDSFNTVQGDEIDPNDTLRTDLKLILSGITPIYKEGSPAQIAALMLGASDANNARMILAPKASMRRVEFNVGLEEDIPMAIIPSKRMNDMGFIVCARNTDIGMITQSNTVIGTDSVITDDPSYSYIYMSYSGLTGVSIVPNVIHSVILKEQGLSSIMEGLGGKALDGMRAVMQSDVISDRVQKVYGSLLKQINLKYLLPDRRTGSVIALDDKNRQVLVHMAVQSTGGIPYATTRAFGGQYATWVPVPDTRLGLLIYGLLDSVGVSAKLQNIDQSLIDFAKTNESYILQDLMPAIYDPTDKVLSKIKKHLQRNGIAVLPADVIS